MESLTACLQISDPALRAKLTPDYEPGCKRTLVSNDYLPSLTRPNVEVVCEGIAEVRGRTVVTRDGAERELDTIILGTGFHVTYLLLRAAPRSLLDLLVRTALRRSARSGTFGGEGIAADLAARLRGAAP